MARILIVDDSKAVHAFVKHCFYGKENVNFVSVFNGAEAVDLLRNDKSFDLILLDWEMPKLTGPEAFQEVKSLGLSIPVIMMTSRNDMSDVAKMLERGCAEYVMKPFTSDILLEKITMATNLEFKHAS